MAADKHTGITSGSHNACEPVIIKWITFCSEDIPAICECVSEIPTNCCSSLPRRQWPFCCWPRTLPHVWSAFAKPSSLPSVVLVRTKRRRRRSRCYCSRKIFRVTSLYYCRTVTANQPTHRRPALPHPPAAALHPSQHTRERTLSRPSDDSLSAGITAVSVRLLGHLSRRHGLADVSTAGRRTARTHSPGTLPVPAS